MSDANDQAGWEQLQDELKRLRTQFAELQAQHATDAEKHQLVTEESLTTNEELRQALENLDAHREELRSVNAELIAANHTLHGKIDELGQANNDLQNLVAASAIATVFLDRELRVTRFTPAAAGLFNLIEHDMGRRLSDLNHELDYAGLEADAALVFAHLKPVEREASATRERWFLVRLLPYRTTDEQIVGVVLTCLDITERKQTEALRQAKESAERVAKARNEFLSRMSHELRTPLNAILGFGQILELESRDERDRLALGLIVKAGRHLLSLVNEVLDLSQADGRELHLTMSAVDPEQVALECVQLVTRLAEVNRVACAVQSSGGSLRPIWTDAQRLRQVLLNLLTNAIKYNRPGGRVTLRFRQDEAGFCSINVRDTGLGIAPEDLSRLFTPFERLHSEHGEIEGTGLGLAITRQLVERLGGSIGVESRPGEGSDFQVKLPIGQVLQQAAQTPSAASGPVPATVATQPVTLLYIEDSASNVQLVQMVVERHWPDWRFLSAGNARAGLEGAGQHAPDLIFLDYQLPDHPGDWVLAELRRDPRTVQIPVLVLTADATDATRQRFLDCGATGFLSKPFGIDEFTQAVREALLLAPRIP